MPSPGGPCSGPSYSAWQRQAKYRSLTPINGTRAARSNDKHMEVPHTEIGLTLVLFVLCASVVWVSGARLAYIADDLADRFQLAKSLVGLLILSLATSLPEVATTLAAAVRQTQDLVLNNLFGGIALQTAVLAMSDF